MATKYRVRRRHYDQEKASFKRSVQSQEAKHAFGAIFFC